MILIIMFGCMALSLILSFIFYCINAFLSEDSSGKMSTKNKAIYRFMKRSCDILFSGLFIIIFCWLYVLIAIIVKFSGSGKVFYKSRHIGKNFKEITLIKFRVMKKDSEYEKFNIEDYDLIFQQCTIYNDPRMTKFGKFLRKTNLEFLPYIWSIFKGDLSIIGPRPILRLDSKEYEDMLTRLSVRPGIIGFGTIEAIKNNIFVEDENLKNNQLHYAANFSFNLDLRIFCGSTVKLFKRGGM